MNLMSQNEPIEISSPVDLLYLCMDKYKDSKFILTNDIDLSTLSFRIFSVINISPPFGVFEGHLDGQNYTIKGLQASSEYDSISAGFFNVNNGTIENINFQDVKIEGNNRAGSVVGENHGKISNCSVSGDIYSDQYCGGITGINYKSGRIKNCVSYGNLSSSKSCGGIVGMNHGVIKNCFSRGQLTDVPTLSTLFFGGITGNNVGGIVSMCASKSEIDIVNHGLDKIVGGIVGKNESEVNSSYFTGEIPSTEQSGLVIGLNMGNVENCYRTREGCAVGIGDDSGVDGKKNLEEIRKSMVVGRI